MILSGLKIKEEIEKGNITIEPFDEGLLNPNSYNYRLADELLELTDEVIDPKKPSNFKIIKLTEEGFILQPNKLYLGRLGLFLQVTAPLGHVGCNHCWTLELKTVQPLKVYPNMKIGQITFWTLDGEKTYTYETGKYNSYTRPNISLYYKNWRGINDIIRN